MLIQPRQTIKALLLPRALPLLAPLTANPNSLSAALFWVSEVFLRGWIAILIIIILGALYSIYSLTVIIIKRFKEKRTIKNKKLRKRGFLLLPLFNFFYQPFNNLFRFQLSNLSCVAGFLGNFPFSKSLSPMMMK